jgi:hypothetical protein
MSVYSNNYEYDENFLEGCTPDNNVIPEYASLNEMAYHVIESSIADYNQMMMEFGIRELAYVEENHRELIYEASGEKNIVEKAIDSIKGLWEKVQSMFKKALATFEEKAQNFREKVMKKIDTKFLKKRVDNLKAGKEFGVTYQYSHLNLTTAYKGLFDKAKRDIMQNYNDALDSSEKEASEGLARKNDAVISTMMHNISNGNNDVKQFKNQLKNYIRGDKVAVKTDWVKKNYDSIISEVTQYPNTKRQLKDDYKALQKQFNDTIKDVKKANDGKRFEANTYTKTVKSLKDLRHINVLCEQATITCLNERESFYRSIMFKLIGTKPVKESYSESTTVDGIQSLFEW